MNPNSPLTPGILFSRAKHAPAVVHAKRKTIPSRLHWSPERRASRRSRGGTTKVPTKDHRGPVKFRDILPTHFYLDENRNFVAFEEGKHPSLPFSQSKRIANRKEFLNNRKETLIAQSIQRVSKIPYTYPVFIGVFLFFAFLVQQSLFETLLP